MTKQQFLDRMSNAYDMGLCEPEILRLAEQWCDGVMRLEGGQMDHFFTFLESENKRTEQFGNYRTLANDEVGYKVIQLMAIFTHHCQKCAIDPDAWHTRSGFCNHNESQSIPVKTVLAEKHPTGVLRNRSNQKLTEVSSGSKKGWAICSDCGDKEYPSTDKSKWNGITVHSGICPVCNEEKTLIPRADWEGHGD